ncbi:hypothetical protein GCM10011579_011990 [Streptomyces albiflavescens]|uniref:Uncharacterized protein n=2 Tax=Streptomyces albiflavescens TaxID=1623582 RepID=A0A918D033_9ACTN|nr:hypothetical protein GCM10011579_011990 [Streptomyces albiflavescens]
MTLSASALVAYWPDSLTESTSSVHVIRVGGMAAVFAAPTVAAVTMGFAAPAVAAAAIVSAVPAVAAAVVVDAGSIAVVVAVALVRPVSLVVLAVLKRLIVRALLAFRCSLASPSGRGSDPGPAKRVPVHIGCTRV